jgi:hypothetical protein
MKAKLRPAAATTAHKIAIIFYMMVKNQVEYDASLLAQRDVICEKRLDARPPSGGCASRVQTRANGVFCLSR